MKSCISVALPCWVVMAVTLSCNSVSGRGDAQTDTVAVDVVKLSDTTSFIKANGEKCDIYADATIQYPVAWDGSDRLAKLQHWFVTQVLDAPDSLNLHAAMSQSVVNTLHQYDMTAQDADATTDFNDDAEAVYRYNTNSTITFYAQQHGILTVCKVDKVTKNDLTTSISHRYYNFDLQNAVPLELGKVFREDVLGDVCQLLKAHLLSQNRATTDEQLNEQGFFNADNMSVTRNFFFDETGITWSYLPNELAVEAVGEPRITLPYSEIKPLAADGSVLNRFE